MRFCQNFGSRIKFENRQKVDFNSILSFFQKFRNLPMVFILKFQKLTKNPLLDFFFFFFLSKFLPIMVSFGAI